MLIPRVGQPLCDTRSVVKRDRPVLVSAALWSENGGSGMVLTHDSGDMLSLEGKINETIDRNTDGSPLHIMEPGLFLAALFSS